MSYSKLYQLSYDIDWFCCRTNQWMHFASRGGLLPGFVDDDKTLPRAQSILSNLPYFVDENSISINEEFISARYQRALGLYRSFEDNDENIAIDTFLENFTLDSFRFRFIESFQDMARRGFYSFARVNIDNPYDNDYKLIAKPDKNYYQQIEDTLRSYPLDDELRSYLKEISEHNDEFELTFDKTYRF